MKLRILYISSHWPHKATCGSEIRAFHIRKALEQVGEVHVAVTDVGDEESIGIRSEGSVGAQHVLPVRRIPKGGILKKVRWALDPRIPFPHGNAVDEEEESRVIRRLQDYHLIWFNKLRTANMFSTSKWPRSVVDVDDVPSTYERSMLSNERRMTECALSAMRAMSWKRREKLLGKRFTLIAVCSEADRQYLKSMNVAAPIHVIPNGAERIADTEPVRNPLTPARIGFVGLMDYFPNNDGIQWFAKECWPRIKREVPDARLRIAGKGSDGPLKPAGPDIEGLGWVPALENEISTWTAMIVPIRIGGGTREKVAYGFSLKCPIVSTSFGAFGYDVRNGEEVLLADTAPDFASACVRILQNKTDVAALTDRAYAKYLHQWDWKAIAPRIWAAADDCLRMSSSNR